MFCNAPREFCKDSKGFCKDSKVFCKHSEVFCKDSKVFCKHPNVFCKDSKVFCKDSKVFCKHSKVFCFSPDRKRLIALTRTDSRKMKLQVRKGGSAPALCLCISPRVSKGETSDLRDSPLLTRRLVHPGKPRAGFYRWFYSLCCDKLCK